MHFLLSLEGRIGRRLSGLCVKIESPGLLARVSQGPYQERSLFVICYGFYL